MSYAAACGWALGHGFVVTVLAVAVARLICGRLVEVRQDLAGRPARLVLWAILLAPFLTPALLVGYAYGDLALELVHHPFWNEVTYMLLTVARLAPVAALVFYFAPPPPLSREAIYCAALAAANQSAAAGWPFGAVRSIFARLSWLARGSARNAAVAAAVVFLLAFGQFEIAALMGVGTWTVWLFDAQAGGLPLQDSLWYALGPMLCELGVLSPLVVMLLWVGQRLPAPAERGTVRLRRGGRIVVRLYLVAALAGGYLVPAWVVLRQTPSGFASLVSNFTILAELRVSLLFAVSASAIALALATILVRPTRGPAAAAVRSVSGLILCLPGLLGSLLVGLTVLAVFQPGRAWYASIFTAWYDTPAPLLVALVLLLMPLAALLCLLLVSARRSAAGASIFLAEQMRAASQVRVRRCGRRLIWMLRGRARFWIFALLCFVAYFDLTASALLSPSGATPVIVKLYNLMHYGQYDVLSAMLCTTVAAFVAVLLIGRGMVAVFQHGSANE